MDCIQHDEDKVEHNLTRSLRTHILTKEQEYLKANLSGGEGSLLDVKLRRRSRGVKPIVYVITISDGKEQKEFPLEVTTRRVLKHAESRGHWKGIFKIKEHEKEFQFAVDEDLIDFDDRWNEDL